MSTSLEIERRLKETPIAGILKLDEALDAPACVDADAETDAKRGQVVAAALKGPIS